MTETIKFNNQELIQSHRINDLNPFYDMLAPTEPDEFIDIPDENNVKAMPIVFKWADAMRKKDIPYAITKHTNENNREKINFWVFGEEKRAIKD